MSLAENTQDQNLGTDDQNNQDHPLGHLIAYLKRAAEESSKKSPWESKRTTNRVTPLSKVTEVNEEERVCVI